MNDSKLRKPIARRPDECGSALLIVLVFAAIIAIMLYREMAVVTFEARRQKEQTLIARGHEYQRAVQLYYRKFQGRYPASIAMLENTNNLRFLRRRYTDPFTGKDDWRMLHAGPGGQLTDSKVRSLNRNPFFGQTGANTGNSNFGTASGGGARNGFGTDTPALNTNPGTGSTSDSSVAGDSASASSDSNVTVAPLVKRAPILAANSSGATPTSNDLNQDPSIPLLPPPTDEPATNPALSTAPGNVAAGSSQQQNTGQNGMQMTQNPFASNQPQGSPAAGGLNSGGDSTTGLTGKVMGGALAGVASKAKGHAIKKINDQTDYSLWEFWYDPSKDTSMGMAGNLQNGAGGQPTNAGAPGMNTPITPTQQNPPASTQSSFDGAGPAANPPPESH